MVGEAVAIAAADGHGSSEHADIGARFAICAALSVFTRFAHDDGGEASDMHPLCVRIVREWREMVRADTDRKDGPTGGGDIYRGYGSTILGAVATPKILLVGQLGDGDVLFVNGNGEVRTPLSSDAAGIGDETESLCLPGAEYAFGIKKLPPPEDEALLLLATDGYGKSYQFRSDFEKIGPDYLDRIRRYGIDKVASRLKTYLRKVTDRGSGDDIAVAMLYWPPPSHGVGDEGRVTHKQSTDGKTGGMDVASRFFRLVASSLKQRTTTS